MITSVPTYQDRRSSIVSFEDIWNIYATPISLTPLDAGSDASRSFIE